MNRFDLNSILSTRRPFLILAFPFVAFVLITHLSFLPIIDESLFNLKVIEQFASSFPDFNFRDYPSSTGPLPYVLWTIVGKVIGFDPWKLRFLTVLISYLASVLFFRTCQDRKIPLPLLKALLLIFFPYIFLNSFTLYTINFALFWQIFSLRYFLRYAESQSKADLAWGSIGSLALILSRQIDVALPLAALCFFLADKRLRTLWSFLGGIVPVIGLLLLMIYWGGAAPLRYQKGYPLSFKPAQFTLLLTALGFYLQPLGFFEGRRWKGWRRFSILLLIPFLLFFPVHYPKEGLGIVYYGIDFIGRRFYSGLSLIGPLYLGLAGGLVFHGIARRIREFPRPPLEFYVFLFYIVLSGFNPYLYERYYYFAWPLVLLLLPRDVSENRYLLILALSILVAVSLVYAKMMLVFPK
jgi:hypothetical protein